MPIVEGLYRTLFEGVPAREVVRALMTRPIKSEFD
jgi:glycerol-3-phosphate dehydrogenase